MNSPLITTKLLIPKPHQGLISRAALLDQLTVGLGNKLTLISASSGYGKTTLMADWFSGRGKSRAAAWVSLDKGDNDPVRFLSYMFAALQNVQDGLGTDTLSVLQGAQNPLEEAFLALLINELSSVRVDFILVLEDYHVIEAQEIHRMLGFLLDHLPPQMHIAIVTRSDPPFPLARMRARGELVEIRARDLRFSGPHASTLLQDVAGLPVSDDDVRLLLERTEGWITGLQLAILSMRGRENLSERIASFGSGHDYIVDYLVEEVLERQPEEIREFLLQTAILDRMNGALCDAVTGRPGGETILGQLYKANLFVSPLGGELGWYRYHPLLADVLRNRLQRFYPDEFPGLHRKAALWFEQNNLVGEAIEHAFSANDYDYAARMADRYGVNLLKDGNLATLMNWLKRFPDSVFDDFPRLNVYRAWALMLVGMITEVGTILAAAEESARERNLYEELRGDFAAVHAYNASLNGDMELAFIKAQEALEWLTRENDTVRSVMAFVLGGIYLMRRDFPGAISSMQEASQVGQRSGNLNLAVSALSAAGSIHLEQGNKAQAERAFFQALELSRGRHGNILPRASSAYAGMAELHLSERAFEQARQWARKGLGLGEQWINVDSRVGCLLTLAQVSYLEGDYDDALSRLEEVKQIASARTLTPSVFERVRNCEAQFSRLPRTADGQRSLIDPLSERELEILALFAGGHTNQEVADKLIISVGTVKAHSSNIYRKLDVRNRTQAVIEARKRNLV